MLNPILIYLLISDHLSLSAFEWTDSEADILVLPDIIYLPVDFRSPVIECI